MELSQLSKSVVCGKNLDFEIRHLGKMPFISFYTSLDLYVKIKQMGPVP